MARIRIPKQRFMIEAWEEHPDHSLSEITTIARKLEKEYRALRTELYYEQAGMCACCGNWIPKTVATLDHIIPWALGGPATWGNAQMMCRTCNGSKSDNVPEDLKDKAHV